MLSTWGGEDSEANDGKWIIALERFVWSKEYADDEKILLEICGKIKFST